MTSDLADVAKDALRTSIPLGRVGSPEDVAYAVAWLAGPGGAYVTGQTLIVDGGRTLWGNTWPIADPDPLPEVEIPVEPWENSED